MSGIKQSTNLKLTQTFDVSLHLLRKSIVDRAQLHFSSNITLFENLGNVLFGDMLDTKIRKPEKNTCFDKYAPELEYITQNIK